MGDYSFVVGNATVIVLLAMMLGPMGMAEGLYGDQFQVVDSADPSVTPQEVENADFDIDELRFVSDKEDVEFLQQRYGTAFFIANESSGDGVITYNTSGVSGDGRAYFTDGNFFATHSQVVTPSDTIGATASSQAFTVDQGEDTLEIRLLSDTSPDIGFIGFQDTEQVYFEADQFQSLDNINAVERDFSSEQEGFFAKASNFLDSVIKAGLGFPSTLWAWISFFLAIPGMIGDFLVLYMGGFAAYLIFHEGWIG